MVTKNRKIYFDATTALMNLIVEHCTILSMQVEAVDILVEQTINEAFSAIEGISKNATEQARIAEHNLEQTYLNSDASTTDYINKVQSSVDDLLNQAQNQQIDSESQPIKDLEESVKNRRLAGLYSKHMEALSTFDNGVTQIILKMMGELSNDDVLRQRLMHVSQCIKGLEKSINYILADIDSRLTKEHIDLMVKDLDTMTLKIYTTEDERQIHINQK